MTVREMAHVLAFETVTGETNLDERVESGYVSDLLSDVIANAPEQSVWITVQRHINILGVAKLKNVAAIVIPRNLKIEVEVIDRARAEGVALLRSRLSAFEIAGLLYALLKKGEECAGL